MPFSAYKDISVVD